MHNEIFLLLILICILIVQYVIAMWNLFSIYGYYKPLYVLYMEFYFILLPCLEVKLSVKNLLCGGKIDKIMP